MRWITSRHDIDLHRVRVMGIVNLTPDSFSDGGLHTDLDTARARCEALVAQGADLLDLGAQSSRPGAAWVSEQEELDRLMPVLERAVQGPVPVSVDTDKPGVMRAALAAGADIINDIRALRAPGALDVVAAHPRCGVCVMHMQGEPATMQQQPHYDDVLGEVADFLADRLLTLQEAGIAADRVALDPGYGFGKTHAHNLVLFQHQGALTALGRPLLVGWSRKSTLGHITGRIAPEDRLAASLGAALAAVQRGARVLRVHDVAATVDALKVWEAAGLMRA